LLQQKTHRQFALAVGVNYAGIKVCLSQHAPIARRTRTTTWTTTHAHGLARNKHAKNIVWIAAIHVNI
jgi:hypothetical protein